MKLLLGVVTASVVLASSSATKTQVPVSSVDPTPASTHRWLATGYLVNSMADVCKGIADAARKPGADQGTIERHMGVFSRMYTRAWEEWLNPLDCPEEVITALRLFLSNGDESALAEFRTEESASKKVVDAFVKLYNVEKELRIAGERLAH